jgi:starch phosphorylase
MPASSIGNVRTGSSVEDIKRAITDHLCHSLGVFPEIASSESYYQAVALTVHDRLQEVFVSTIRAEGLRRAYKVVIYLSAEYLMGPQLLNNLINLGIHDQVRIAVAELGKDLDQLIEHESEPGLGSGGLGRLAACYLDSLATLKVPTVAYGIRYEFGIFEQSIENGWQVEKTDIWLGRGTPWDVQTAEAHRPEVGFEGHTVPSPHGEFQGSVRNRWKPGYVVRGIPYTWPVSGYRSDRANLLRLWRAEACESFDFQNFNKGDYYGAVEQKILSENLSKVLYPNDEPVQGKVLRLKQQYFLVSCALQDLIRFLEIGGIDVERFHEHFAIQLNDTHPALAVPELMRLLVDVHGVDWDKAWRITCNSFAYTNHTLLPEALEIWPLPMFEQRLPRHLEIIYEINARLLDEVRRKFPGDSERVRRMSLIDDSGERYVRMANMACAGSHSINGVSQLHSELLKSSVLRDFYEYTPEKFSNVTNGVTPRRFLRVCNPALSELITHRIGDQWLTRLDTLRLLEPLATDPDFAERWRAVKQGNKSALASYLHQHTGIVVDPAAMFDVQVKRIHEYKRQLLNVLHIVTLYNRIRAQPDIDLPPRTFIFGGKAAPGYQTAKLIIKLIVSVASVVNKEPAVADRLKVVFFPNFNVKSGQRIYPAADLSEQISTAGKEASGTGNMKFSLNGALTIGTLDGANIEIRDEVGEDNFFLFGLTATEIEELRCSSYVPWDVYAADSELKAAIDLINRGFFAPERPDLFKPLMGSLLHHDQYMVLADYRSYVSCQERVSAAYRDARDWTRMSILNVARMGRFSSDRAIEEYCSRIWHVDVPAPGP